MQVAHGGGAAHGAGAAHGTGAAHGASHPHTAHHGQANQGHTAHHAPKAAHHVAHARPAIGHAPAHSAVADASHAAPSGEISQVGEAVTTPIADNGFTAQEIGKAVHAPETLKQEIGLKAVAKSL
jgi:hypothetical protein